MFEIEDAKKLYEILKEFIVDILVFGSSIKGKEKPSDIDILIILKDRKYFEEVAKNIPPEFNYIALTLDELIYSNFLLKGIILSESISVKTNKKFAELLFGSPYMIYELYLLNPTNSKRVLLYYFLKGRRNILSNINGELLKIIYKEHSEQPVYVAKIPLQYSSYFEEELRKYCKKRNIKLKIKRKIIIEAETTFL